jgi:hypothetical protein
MMLGTLLRDSRCALHAVASLPQERPGRPRQCCLIQKRYRVEATRAATIVGADHSNSLFVEFGHSRQPSDRIGHAQPTLYS